MLTEFFCPRQRNPGGHRACRENVLTLCGDGVSRMHEHLWTLCRCLPSDFQPYGERDRDTEESWQDCSCGCRHFVPLQGQLGHDWGVCANAKSPRAGLLTFEHQGCAEFEAEAE